MNSDKSNAEVAGALEVSERMVRSYAKKLREQGRHPNVCSKGGRPRKISQRISRYMRREALEGVAATKGDLQQMLRRHYGVRVLREIVRKELMRHGLQSCKKRIRAFLKRGHKKARLAFAREHREWTVRDWERVLFSDEKRFPIDTGDGPERCFRKRGAPLRDRDCKGIKAHGGGSIMVWGCFGRDGVGGMALLEGSVNAEAYTEVCGPSILNSLHDVGLGTEEGIFQQDNARPHIARSSMAWFEDNEVTLLKWPARSPDLNPIDRTLVG